MNQEIFRQLWVSPAIRGGNPLNTDFLWQPLKCVWRRKQDSHTVWRHHQYVAHSRTSKSGNYLDLCGRHPEVQSIWDIRGRPCMVSQVSGCEVKELRHQQTFWEKHACRMRRYGANLETNCADPEWGSPVRRSPSNWKSWSRQEAFWGNGET